MWSKKEQIANRAKFWELRVLVDDVNQVSGRVRTPAVRVRSADKGAVRRTGDGCSVRASCRS